MALYFYPLRCPQNGIKENKREQKGTKGKGLSCNYRLINYTPVSVEVDNKKGYVEKNKRTTLLLWTASLSLFSAALYIPAALF